METQDSQKPLIHSSMTGSRLVEDASDLSNPGCHEFLRESREEVQSIGGPKVLRAVKHSVGALLILILIMILLATIIAIVVVAKTIDG